MLVRVTITALFILSMSGCKKSVTQPTKSVNTPITDSTITNYYQYISSQSGNELKAELHLLIRNHTKFSYNDVYDIIAETDRDPNDTANVILLYLGRSQDKDHRDRGATYDYASAGYTYSDSYNREHVWAKSHGFPNTSDTAYTDLHHIRPADRTVNSARNTRSFNEATVPYLDNGGTIPTPCLKGDGEYSWEPREEVKGDIARMIFYMCVRYEGTYDLELVDNIEPSGTNTPTHGKLSTLKQWHIDDPVDSFEVNRNNVIFFYQGNRNPFIDHPEYVELIW